MQSEDLFSSRGESMIKNERKFGLGIVVGLVLLMSMFSLRVVPTQAEAAIVPAWTVGPALNDNRSQSVVVQDDEGLVYVIGGIREGTMFTPLVNVSSYDVDTGAWTNLQSLPKSTRGAAGAYLDGKIYVFGGYSAGWIADTQIYDISSNTWSTGTSMPVALWNARACAGNDGMIYVFGGKTAGWAHTNAVNIYDPTTDGWDTGAVMPAGLSGGAVVSSGSYIYYIGGETGAGATSAIYRYYIWGNSWYSSLAPLPRTTTAHAAVMGMDGMIYAFGGASTESEGAAGTNWSYYYQPWNDAWQNGPNLTRNCMYLSGVATVDGRILAMGGLSSNSVSSKVDSMRVMSYSASVAPSTVPSGRSLLVTVSVDFANAVPEYYQDAPYLASLSGTSFDGINIDGLFSGTCAFQIVVPEGAAAGAYEVVLPHFYVGYVDGGSINLPEQRLPVVVVVGDTLDEQIASLEDEIANLQAQLAAADGNVTTIMIALQQLGATFAALQAQLDDMQEQVDRIENKADTASTYGLVTLVLVIIVIVLVALIMIMARRGGKQ
jgi:N-acetylneuraminic acid mutarotase